MSLLRARNLFFPALAGICLLAIAVRFPGLFWLSEVAPYRGFSFHPDVMRFLRAAADFQNAGIWGGYPLGLSTHLFLARALLEAAGFDPDPVLLIRSISLAYGTLTVLVSGLAARGLTGNPYIGLLTALFLAVSPLHVVHSHFGTADSTATFYVIAGLVFGWRWMKHSRELDFVLFATCIGISLATKFFVPLLVPLAIVVWHDARKIERGLLTALLLAGSFSAANFFNYTPWDFSEHLRMLFFENVTIVGGFTPLDQLRLYSWGTIYLLGIATWLFFAFGLVNAITVAGRRWRHNLPTSLSSWYDLTRSPHVVPVSAYVAYLAALIAAEGHGFRHFLPWVPLLCFVAAFGFYQAARYLRARPAIVASLFAVTMAYQLYAVAGIESHYAFDIRYEIADRIAELAGPDDDVVTFSEYSYLRGTRMATATEEDESRIDSEFFVTCSLEFYRYFTSTDAAEVFHAYGGQRRLDFFRDLFASRTEYEPVFEVRRPDHSFEDWLVSKGILYRFGLFTPAHCVLFRKRAEADD